MGAAHLWGHAANSILGNFRVRLLRTEVSAALGHSSDTQKLEGAASQAKPRGAILERLPLTAAA